MDDKHCLLVIVGATVEGEKELVAIEGGAIREHLNPRSVLIVYIA
jgi:hypothetical protein